MGEWGWKWGYRLEKESGTHTLDVLHLYDSPSGEVGLEIRERDEPIPWMYCIYVILLVGEWGYRLEKESGTHTLDVLHLCDSPSGEVGLEIRERDEPIPWMYCIYVILLVGEWGYRLEKESGTHTLDVLYLCDSPGRGVGI